MTVFHQYWGEVGRLEIVENFHCGGLSFGPSHGPAVGEAVCWREVAGRGAAGVLEEGNGGHSSSQVLLKIEAQAMDGGGVCNFQGGVAWVGWHVLEDGQGQFELDKPGELQKSIKLWIL